MSMTRRASLVLLAIVLSCATAAAAQIAPRLSLTPAAKSPATASRPKLVVVIVVDQMRADYIEKFRGRWTGGLKRLLEHGAWVRGAKNPYAATGTCVGDATIFTGALPPTRGTVANAWGGRASKKNTTWTPDPKGGD